MLVIRVLTIERYHFFQNYRKITKNDRHIQSTICVFNHYTKHVLLEILLEFKEFKPTIFHIYNT